MPVSAERAWLHRHPLVAILRGVSPGDVESAGEVLVEAGIRTIEVPLNSPGALRSIERLALRLEGRALLGAGTVLTAAQVDSVEGAGARVVLSPNRDRDVIARAAARGLYAMPGVATVSEAFEALDAGAHGLKLFPADVLGPASFKAWKAVLPADIDLFAVGGVANANLAGFRAAGARGAGLGGSLYTPGMAPDELGRRARTAVAAWEATA